MFSGYATPAEDMNVKSTGSIPRDRGFGGGGFDLVFGSVLCFLVLFVGFFVCLFFVCFFVLAWGFF